MCDQKQWKTEHKSLSSGCQVLMRKLYYYKLLYSQGYNVQWKISNIVKDILKLLDSFMVWDVKHVNHDDNFIAHNL